MKKIFTITALAICLFISKSAIAQTGAVPYKYTGTIGNNAVIVTFLELDQWYDRVQGYYVYTKDNKNIEFRGEEMDFEGEQKLTESKNGQNTGYFIFYDLDYSKTKITGKWFTMDGEKSYDVLLTKSK